MASMATPINKLPADAYVQGETDDMVSAVLEDMEKEMAASEPPKKQVQFQQQAQPTYRVVPPEYFSPPPPASWMTIDMENLKQAGVIMVLSFLIFQPNLTNIIYEKLPKLSILASYDLFVRAALMGVFFYIILTHVRI